MSKQVPIMLAVEVRNLEQEDNILSGRKENNEILKIMFKYGDDLRQDNLVL